MHVAASKNHAEIVGLFLQHGADVNLKDEHGRTPLLVSAYFGAKDSLKTLIESNLCNPYDTTPTAQNCLHLAGNNLRFLIENNNAIARYGHADMIAFLCACDMETHRLRRMKDCNNRTPLQVIKSASFSEHFEVISHTKLFSQVFRVFGPWLIRVRPINWRRN